MFFSGLCIAQEVNFGPPLTLYHATSSANAESITAMNFLGRGKGGKAGSGIYLADTPQRAADRARHGNEATFEVVVRNAIPSPGGAGNYVVYHESDVLSFRWINRPMYHPPPPMYMPAPYGMPMYYAVPMYFAPYGMPAPFGYAPPPMRTAKGKK